MTAENRVFPEPAPRAIDVLGRPLLEVLADAGYLRPLQLPPEVAHLEDLAAKNEVR